MGGVLAGPGWKVGWEGQHRDWGLAVREGLHHVSVPDRGSLAIPRPQPRLLGFWKPLGRAAERNCWPPDPGQAGDDTELQRASEPGSERGFGGRSPPPPRLGRSPLTGA